MQVLGGRAQGGAHQLEASMGGQQQVVGVNLSSRNNSNNTVLQLNNGESTSTSSSAGSTSI